MVIKNIKIELILFVVLLGILMFFLANYISKNELGADKLDIIDKELLLKVDKEKILEDKIKTKKILKPNIDVSNLSEVVKNDDNYIIEEFVEYTYISNEEVKDEYIFEDNNKFSGQKVLSRGNNGAVTVEFTKKKVYKDDNGKVYKIKYGEEDGATTSVEAWEEQTKEPLISRIFQFFTKEALAVDLQTFTSDGTFTATTSGEAVWLIVGGGGGGGDFGGGGAGGFRYGTSTLSAGDYPVIVGAGGTKASAGSQGSDGATSSFNSFYSAGGGGGGSFTSGAAKNGRNGGSGGGGGTISPGSGGAGGLGNQPPTSPVQGYNGGVGDNSGIGYSGGGGGGGCQIGEAANTDGAAYGGDGGNGCISAITGTDTYYAGGGAGGGSNGPNTGGLGGGGNGKDFPSVPGTAGTDGLGGGGGGGYADTGNGDGGDGIVIISFTPDGGGGGEETPFRKIDDFIGQIL